MTSKDYVHRKIYPSKIFGGIGFICAGMVIVIIFKTIGVMPQLLLIGGMAAIPIGVLTILLGFGRECIQCKQELENRVISVSGKMKKELRNAFDSSDINNVTKLIQTNKSERALNAIEVKCIFCAKCRSVTFLKVAGWPKIFYAGDGVEKLLTAVIE